MRKNNPDEMTIVEQIIVIKEEVCNFCCMFKEYVNDEFEDEQKKEEMLKGYCERCPLTRLHFTGKQ